MDTPVTLEVDGRGMLLKTYFALPFLPSRLHFFTFGYTRVPEGPVNFSFSSMESRIIQPSFFEGAARLFPIQKQFGATPTPRQSRGSSAHPKYRFYLTTLACVSLQVCSAYICRCTRACGLLRPRDLSQRLHVVSE